VSEAAVQKARAIRMVAMDVDGVLTDGRATCIGPARGPGRLLAWLLGRRVYEALAFNVQDGSGIKYLERAGIGTAIISGRRLEAVNARARELGIREVFQDAKVKAEAWESLLARTGLSDRDVAYVGDDLPDIPLLRRAGLAVAVANAVPEVRQHADLVTTRSGGQGAVRELAEFILKAQGKWVDILSRYVDNDELEKKGIR